jgi:carbamoyl-phosphate synthase small subunit
MKMNHGHHGANHPVQNLETGTVMITSQNHGFAVDADTLPANLKATHKSLFDGTNKVFIALTNQRLASKVTLKQAQVHMTVPHCSIISSNLSKHLRSN